MDEEREALAGIELKLTVNLGPIGLDDEEFGRSLADAIVAQAAAQLLDRLKRDDVYSTLHSKVERVRIELITEALRPKILEALDAPLPGRPHRFLDGVPREDPTLGDVIVDEARRFLSEEVSPSGLSGSKRSTRLAQMIGTMVDRKFESELAQAVADARGRRSTSSGIRLPWS